MNNTFFHASHYFFCQIPLKICPMVWKVPRPQWISLFLIFSLKFLYSNLATKNDLLVSKEPYCPVPVNLVGSRLSFYRAAKDLCLFQVSHQAPYVRQSVCCLLWECICSWMTDYCNPCPLLVWLGLILPLLKSQGLNSPPTLVST